MPVAAVTHHRLAPRGLIVLPDAAGTEVRCLSGTLWVTLDGDPRDIVLEPGDTFAAGEHRRVIVFALRPSAVQVCRQAAEPAPVRAWRGILSAAALMLRRPSPTWGPAHRG